MQHPGEEEFKEFSFQQDLHVHISKNFQRISINQRRGESDTQLRISARQRESTSSFYSMYKRINSPRVHSWPSLNKKRPYLFFLLKLTREKTTMEAILVESVPAKC